MISPASELIGALVVDGLFGDPRKIPHPVCGVSYIARTIESYTRPPADSSKEKLFAGAVMSVLTVGSTVVCAEVLSRLGMPFKVGLLAFGLAGNSLFRAGDEVYYALQASDIAGNLNQARQVIGCYVGRDTDNLNETEVVRATVETLAENTNDGFIAPLFWGAVGSVFGHGPAFMWGYKAVSTLDSLYGYKDERNKEYGRCAARLDDACAYIPARITACSAVVAAACIGENAQKSAEVVLTDHDKHASPNAGWPEAAFAGALDVKLGGPASYQGEPVDKPHINPQGKTVTRVDIRRTQKLVFATGLVASIAIVGAVSALSHRSKNRL